MKTVTSAKMILIWCLVLFCSAFVAAQEEDISIGKIVTIKSQVLNEERRIWISLPEDYDNGKELYPILLKCDAMGKGHFMARVNDIYNGISAKTIPAVILVSIENTDRSRDMYPQDDVKKGISGEADKFQAFIETELIPYLEKTFRTDNFRILMGESDSSMFAVYSMLSKPQIFNAYIASSPELGYFGDYFHNLYDKSIDANDFSKTKLFIIHGDKDNSRILESVPPFIDLLKQNQETGLTWKYSVIKDAGHVPSESMLSGLEFIYSGYYAPDEIIKAGTDSIEKYYQELGQKLGYSMKVPASAYTRLAMEKLSQNDNQQALEIFKMIASNYSSKADLLTPLMSMARLYQQEGNIDKTIACFRKVIEIWPMSKLMIEKRIDRLKKQ